MGKNTWQKKKPEGPSTPPMSSFFTPNGPRQFPASDDSKAGKMVGAMETAEWEAGEPMSRAEWRQELAGGFQKMEGALLEKISALITPLLAQIQEIKQAVDQVAQTAENAMELSLTNKEAQRQWQA